MTGSELEIAYLLVSFVDVFGYRREVCAQFADRFHNRCPVWCVLENDSLLESILVGKVRGKLVPVLA